MRTCLLCLGSLLAGSSLAHAQVIEVDADGQSRTYDRPTMFTAAEATPIVPTVAMVPSASSLAEVGRAHGLAPGLLEAVAWQESRGQMSAVSPKGALGVMQLMPATAAALGVDPRNLADNIRGGALYLRRQLDRFGSVPLALAAYNAGPGAVKRFGGIPPFRETRAYVAAIMSHWRPQTVASSVKPLLIEVPSL